DVAAFSNQHFIITGGDQPERINGARVTPNLFSLLQIQAAEGRVFAPDENTPGREPVIVLSNGFWKRRFTGNRQILNQLVTLDDERYKVVGVMPEGFEFPHASLRSMEPADVFVPL